MLDKKIIWAIVGLMSAALIGLIMLQIYWINWSVNLNENNFDRNVRVAMNTVAQKLQSIEDRQKDQDVVRIFQGTGNANILSYKYTTGSTIIVDSAARRRSLRDFRTDANNETQSYLRRSLSFETEMLKAELNPTPVSERIELDHLDALLEQEFDDLGINIEFGYGVYSLPKKAFVIKNGHYLFENSNPQNDYIQNSGLYKTKFKARLFPKDERTMGMLYVDFPNKRSHLWSSLWQSLFASILFTGLILLCFVYTINVIFRQKKLSEMKTDFVNNMTHEFKTPIATISLAADSISSPMISGDAAKVQRFADIIKEENKRMNSQVEKVLQMAMIDKKDFQVNFSKLNLHELIEQSVIHSNLVVSKKNGIIRTDLKAENFYMQGDQTHISNILHNLLDNANKYSPGEPEILVSTKNKGNGIELSVADKGIGMTAENKKQIFDKFYRVHTGDLHDVKGFGLGLSYVKAIVTAHKGLISVESALGVGSTFILFFPHHVEK